MSDDSGLKWKIGKCWVSLREIILFVCLCVLAILVIVFAALYGDARSGGEPSPQPSVEPGAFCSRLQCLKTAELIETLSNVSVDPCQDFFQYACGNYASQTHVSKQKEFDNILQFLERDNRASLQSIFQRGNLGGQWNTATTKAVSFYSACADVVARNMRKGEDFVNKLKTDMGGLYLTDGAWNPDTWDLNRSLQRTQATFLAGVFFSAVSAEYPTEPARRIIAVLPVLGENYDRPIILVKPREEQKKMMRELFNHTAHRLALHVLRDAGTGSQGDEALADRVQVFVNDAYALETMVAEYLYNGSCEQPVPIAEAASKMMTIEELQRTTGSEIDWVSLLSYVFTGVPVTTSTEIGVPCASYLADVAAMIRDLDSDSRNRMLNNYMVWKMLEMFAQDLSWDYVSDYESYHFKSFGTGVIVSYPDRCFKLTVKFFDVAVSSIFLKEHFTAETGEKVLQMAEGVRKALQQMIASNTWMDDTTKRYASAKIKALTYKVGYTSVMKDPSQLEAMYDKFEISGSHFFNDLLNGLQHLRRRWVEELKSGESSDRWPANTFTPTITTFRSWDQVFVPAGLLRTPVYADGMPLAYVYGGLGSLLGHYTHHVIDENGRRWDKSNNYITSEGGWWSSQTLKNYAKNRQCVADLYGNVTQGPFKTIFGLNYVKVDGEKVATQAEAVTSGLRLALQALEAWLGSNGPVEGLPGLTYSPQQLFFVGHAQLYCYHGAAPFHIFDEAKNKNVMFDARVNVPLRELPEFRKAFGCKASDKMVSEKPCTYY